MKNVHQLNTLTLIVFIKITLLKTVLPQALLEAVFHQKKLPQAMLEAKIFIARGAIFNTIC